MSGKRIDRKKDVEAGTVTFTEVASNDSLVCDAATLFPDYAKFNEVQKQTVLHAINAKAGDSAAAPGEPAIPLIKKTWDNLVAGIWAEHSTGEGVGRITDLAKVIANVMTAAGNEVSESDVAKAMVEWDDDKKTSYKNDPRVQAEIKRLQAARARDRAKEADKAAKDTELPELSL